MSECGGSAMGAAASRAAGHSVLSVPTQGQRWRHAGAVLVALGSWVPCCHHGCWQHAQSPRHTATKHGMLQEPPAPPGAQPPPSHPPMGNAPGPMRKDGTGTGCPGTRSRHATLGTMPRTSSSQSCELTTRSCFLLKFCTSTSADPQRGCDGHGAPWQGAVPAARCRCPGLSALCRQQQGQASAAPRPLPQDAAQHPARLSSTLCQQEPL